VQVVAEAAPDSYAKRRKGNGMSRQTLSAFVEATAAMIEAHLAASHQVAALVHEAGERT